MDYYDKKYDRIYDLNCRHRIVWNQSILNNYNQEISKDVSHFSVTKGLENRDQKGTERNKRNRQQSRL